MASSEAEPEKLGLGVSDHASHAETGGSGEGETKKPTKLSDFSLEFWVSVLCCVDCRGLFLHLVPVSIVNKCSTKN